MSNRTPHIRKRAKPKRCDCDDITRLARLAIKRIELQDAAKANGARRIAGEFDCEVCEGVYTVNAVR